MYVVVSTLRSCTYSIARGGCGSCIDVAFPRLITYIRLFDEQSFFRLRSPFDTIQAINSLYSQLACVVVHEVLYFTVCAGKPVFCVH